MRMSLLLIMFVGGLLSPAMAQSPVVQSTGNDPVLYWNDVALQAVVDDHTFVYLPPGQLEHEGPTRVSRNLAIVHLAIFDAVNAIEGGFEPYLPVDLPEEVRSDASVDVAVAQAAHDVLSALYPVQADAGVFAAHLDRALRKGKGDAQSNGVAVGRRAAENLIALRLSVETDPALFDDGVYDPQTAPVGIGQHEPEPGNPFPAGGNFLLTPKWGSMWPFCLDVDKMQVDFVDGGWTLPAPPRPDGTPEEQEAYAEAYDEVKAYGRVDSEVRTADQTEIAWFWSYNGTLDLGPPPRLYNQATRVIAQQERNSVIENARLFALVNMAMADAAIVSWHNKYIHNYWRPVIGIIYGDDDGNEMTVGDPDWKPLGASATNESFDGINFTPPFPAYTSGHATFGAAAFEVLEHLYGENYSFRLRSDEWFGRNTDNEGNHRPTSIRTFESFDHAKIENALSRIYNGVHWRYDGIDGILTGDAIAEDVVSGFLRPVE